MAGGKPKFAKINTG